MASYTPGTYEGAARGYGGKLFVRVTVSEVPMWEDGAFTAP